MGAKLGQNRKETCVNGHDLTDDTNVRSVRRKRNGKVYKERQCITCVRDRSREWWRTNRAKGV